MAGPCGATHLSRSAALDFDHYIAGVEAQLAKRHSSRETYFATLNLQPGRRAGLERELLAGGLWIEPVNGGARELDGALLHHWRGAAWIPGASPKSMLALLRDYDHRSTDYAPQVLSARALEDHGETARIAVRLKQHQIITIVLDGEYEVESRLLTEDRGVSFSRSVHIWEIDSPGTRGERRRREGDDDGFLWRLDSYWTFGRVRDGLLIECEAVSLTRDVPPGLGWLIAPIIESLPREALKFTLNATKKALEKEAH